MTKIPLSAASPGGRLNRRAGRRAACFLYLCCASFTVQAQEVIIRDAATPRRTEERYPAYKREPGPETVRVDDFEWQDARRNRALPGRVFAPTLPAADRKLPLIVLSPGLRGDRTHYRYLARHWAGHGFIVIVLTHVGSDAAATARERDARDAAQSADNWIARVRDVSFALDEIERQPQLARWIDLDRVGVAGHGFGAQTAMLLAGVTVDLPKISGAAPQSRVSLRDPRIRAAVALSPPGRDRFGLTRDSWSRVAAPLLYLIANDDRTFDDRHARYRSEALRRTSGADQYQVEIDDADYFSLLDAADVPVGERRRPPPAEHQEAVLMATTAFFDAYLRADAFAQQWLLDDVLEKRDRRRFKVSHKNVAPVFDPWAFPPADGVAPPPGVGGE